MSIKLQRKIFNVLFGILLAIVTLQLATLAVVSYGLLRATVCVLFCLFALFTVYWAITPLDCNKRRKYRK